MNYFLAIYWKRKSDFRVRLDGLEEFLPLDPARLKSWQSPDRSIEIHSFALWDEALRTDSYLHERRNSALTFNGALLPPPGTVQSGDGPALAFQLLRDEGPERLKEWPGEFSVCLANGSNLHVYSTLGGSCPIFYTNQAELVAFSNRQAFLLSLPGVSGEMDVKSAAWMCYQGYIQNGRSPFSEVKRLAPGALAEVSTSKTLSISRASHADIIDRGISEHYRRDRKGVFEATAEQVGNYIKAVHRFFGSPPLTLPLSGGKDSRLILSLLNRGGLMEQIAQIYTDGPLYSPDVLSAGDLCREIGYKGHQINRSPLITAEHDLDPNLILRSLDLTEGMLSAFDFVGEMAHRSTFSVSGHQNALRDNYYGACKTGSLDEFLKDVLRHHFHDPMALLNPAVRPAFLRSYQEIFSRYHDEGVPVADLGDLYMLRQRNAYWVGTMCQTASLGGPICNPLLHDRAFRLVFSLPAEVRQTEMFHFVATHWGSPSLVAIPFANDNWRPSLKEKLQGILDVPQVAPYRSHANFPNMSNPFLSSSKLIYYQGLKPVMAQLLEEQAAFAKEYLDVKKARAILESRANPGLTEMLTVMGLYSTLLLKNYGRALFSRRQRDALIEDMRARLEGGSPGSRTGTGRDAGTGRDSQDSLRAETHEKYISLALKHALCVEALLDELKGRAPAARAAEVIEGLPEMDAASAHWPEERIMETFRIYEAAIARLVKQLRNEAAPLPPPSAMAAPVNLWKTIEIRNKSGRPLGFSLLIEEKGKEARQSAARMLEGESSFPYGVEMKSGMIRFMILKDGEYFEQSSLRVSEDVENYFMDLV